MHFEKAYFEAAFGTPKQLKPSDFKEVAFSGRSNVGKSSLINKILNILKRILNKIKLPFVNLYYLIRYLLILYFLLHNF